MECPSTMNKNCIFLQWNALYGSESFQKTRLKHDKVRTGLSVLKRVLWKRKYGLVYDCCIRSILLHTIHFEVNLNCFEVSSTLCRINLKTQLWERKRNKCSVSTLECFRWLFTYKISKYHIFRHVDYLGRWITWQNDVSVFEKLRIQKVLHPH